MKIETFQTMFKIVNYYLLVTTSNTVSKLWGGDNVTWKQCNNSEFAVVFVLHSGFLNIVFLILTEAWNTHLTSIMFPKLRSHLWPWAFCRHLREYQRPWLQTALPSLFFIGTQNWSEKQEVAWSNQKDQTSPSLCLSVSVHADRPSWSALVHLGYSKYIIQLSFYLQAINYVWIVNQRRGVSSLDWSTALMGPQGPWWSRTKPLHSIPCWRKSK